MANTPTSTQYARSDSPLQHERLGHRAPEELVREGVLERMPYQEVGTRTRYEYRLTPAGWDLRPVLLALLEWGDKHRADEAGAPMIIMHDGCQAPVHVAMQCADGHPVDAQTRLRFQPGPGARRIA